MTGPREDRRRSYPAPDPEEAAPPAAWWGAAWTGTVARLTGVPLDPDGPADGAGGGPGGTVDAVTATPGRIVSYVLDDRPRPYRTEILIEVLPDADWEELLRATAADPARLAGLLEGEVPRELADTLLPGPGELRVRCSCPTEGRPACGHVRALARRTARLLDADPFLLPLLRGRGEGELVEDLGRRHAAHAARERPEPAAGLPGVPARTALLPRTLPPLPPPLPDPSAPGHPPACPEGPGAPDPLALDQLATDAAVRAHALLTTGTDPLAGLTLWQDAVRLAAAHPTSGLTGSARALYRDLARAAERPLTELARAAAAWRLGGGRAGLEVLEEPWDPPAGPFDRAGPALLAAGSGRFRPDRNRLTAPGRQLRLGRDGLWYPYGSLPAEEDWWPSGPPHPDPVAALAGSVPPGDED
ncbi:hypothetical protein [Streptomyces sp. NPDC097619]|uniref:SWIM zinc finger family protein n=1 Tax=Streptomyces sp. NPDC097619 TaxID=3157228 RepID=UPI003325BDA7